MNPNFWRAKNVLVTGAGGFIGSQLAARLRSIGANVVAAVGNINKFAIGLSNIGCIVEDCDVTDPDKIRRLISLHDIDIVYHLAAFSIVRLAARDPVSTYNVNVMGTVNVLEACRSVGHVQKVVVASSDKAYGDHVELPYLESFSLQPKNTYDVSKACMDMISRSYAHNYGLPVVVTRCSNVYGPGDMNKSRIVPNTIDRVLHGEPPMLYADVQDMVREFVYVDDVVEAYVLLGESGEKTNGRAFNIGGTQSLSVRDVVSTILNVMKRNDLVPIVKEREGTFKEIGRQYLDAWELEDKTGWEPTIGIREGLSRTVDWYRNNR